MYILFLTANPIKTPQLRLDEEIREIDARLRAADFRDLFEIRQHWAVRHSDLTQTLLLHKPHIVHFSGHGSKQGAIILEDETGKSHPTSASTLAKLFGVLKDNIRCVVLNACWSTEQAEAIAQEIDCVVGMRRSISDEAAIRFASGFYQALGFGRNVQEAFDLGCIEIDLANIPEDATPQLITKPGVSATNIVFKDSKGLSSASSSATSNQQSHITTEDVQGAIVGIGGQQHFHGPVDVEVNIQTPPYDALDFTPAAPGEILFIVAEFKGKAPDSIDIQNHIRNGLDQMLPLDTVRIANTKLVMHNDDEAKKLLLASQAHAVVWGWQDQITLTCHLDVAQNPKQVESLRQVYVRRATKTDFDEFKFKIAFEVPDRLSFVAQLLVGYLWYWRDNYENSASVFEACLQTPTDSSVHNFNRWIIYYYLGYSYVQLTHWSKAIGVFSKAIELNPKHVKSLINRGLAYHCLNNITAAENDYRTATELDPDAADAYYNWACLAATQGNDEEAIEYLKKAIELDPNQRAFACDDEDFESLRESSTTFQTLVG